MSSRSLLAFAPTEARGGAEEYLLTFMRYVIKEGWTVHLAIPRGAGSESVVQEAVQLGVKVHVAAPAAPATDLLTGAVRVLQEFRAALRITRTVRPQAALLCLPAPQRGLGIMLALRCAGVPTTTVFQLVPGRFSPSPLRRLLYRVAFWKADHVCIAVSDENRGSLVSSIPALAGRTSVVRNGVACCPVTDYEKAEARSVLLRELGLAPSVRLGITVGRLAPQKGHDYILAALHGLRSKHPELHMVWVGEGPLRNDLETQLRELDVTDVVHLLGHRRDVKQLLLASDLFILPSRFEGASFALLEAMAAGLPVIVSNSPALTEIVNAHGRVGWVFDPLVVGSLEGAVSSVLNDEVRAAKVGDAGVRRVATAYEQSEMLARTLELVAR